MLQFLHKFVQKEEIIVKIKKLLSLLASAAVTVTALTGSLCASALEGEGQTYEGNAAFIGSYLNSQYFGNTAFEVNFYYESFDPDGTYQDEETGELKTIDYNDTFQFLVFDQDWQGWDKTIAGPQGVNISQPPLTADDLSLFMPYSVTVDIATIESMLSTGLDPFGINLQLGGVGDTKVFVESINYVKGEIGEGEEVTITGEWEQFKGGTLEVVNGSAHVYTNANNNYILVSNFSTEGFVNPTVDVTVTYLSPQYYLTEAEIKTLDGDPINDYYAEIDAAGTYTYTTELPINITGLIAVYGSCIVNEIHIYDNYEGNALDVSGKSASTINSKMQPGYTLGNALDAVNKNGEVDETAYGNPPVTEKLFQEIKSLGFKSVKIPITYLNMVDTQGHINEDYLDRIQTVVDRALDTGLYVVINIHNDGGRNVPGKWIDISLPNGSAAFNDVVYKFSNMWSEIATRFKDYNQALVFEDMNEVIIGDEFSITPNNSQFYNAYANITELNQAFVDAVRGTGDDANDDRCLIVPGYNDNINSTVAGFEYRVFDMPKDTSTDRQMLSVHYYDPTNFTLPGQPNDTSVWDINDQYNGQPFMISQLTRVSDYGVPIYLGEYSAAFKNNINYVANYIASLNFAAKEVSAASGTSFSTAYWDNGVIGVDSTGTGLIDRRFNIVTSTGTAIVGEILNPTPDYSLH